MEEKGMMPAHVLGMWPAHWAHLYNFMVPFPKKKVPDATKKMKEKGMGKKGMLKAAEKFFMSIGRYIKFCNHSISETAIDRSQFSLSLFYYNIVSVSWHIGVFQIIAKLVKTKDYRSEVLTKSSMLNHFS